MKKTLSYFKRYVPTRLWQSGRKAWHGSVDAFRSVGPSVRSKNYCGLKVFYNRGNAIVRRLKKEPIFEREMCEAIVSELGKGKPGNGEGPVFLDIGANIGLVSAYVVSKIPKAVVHAFEPGAVQRSLLETTVRENGIEHFTVYPQALGKESGERDLYVHDSKEMGKDSLADTGRGGRAMPVRIRMTTLDEWWESHGRPKADAVKIDTEGAELWVLEGGKEFLKACRPVVFLEIEPLNLRAFPYTHLDILEFFAREGYGLSTLGGEKADRENLGELMKKGEDTYVARPLPSSGWI